MSFHADCKCHFSANILQLIFTIFNGVYQVISCFRGDMSGYGFHSISARRVGTILGEEMLLHHLFADIGCNIVVKSIVNYLLRKEMSFSQLG